MNDLQIINRGGQLLIDSRQVAEMIGRPHNDLMKSIRQFCEYLNRGNFSLVDFFIESTYEDGKGETRPCYLITRKGCDMVANKLTGEKGVLFTATYVTQFEEMERQLNKPVLPSMTQAQIVAAVAQMAVEQERQLQQLAAAQATTIARVEQIENKIEKRITDDFGLQLVTPTQIGKMFEPALSGQAVNARLKTAGLQWRAGGEWVASVEGKKYSSAEPLTLDGGKMIYQLKWQRRVKELIT